MLTENLPASLGLLSLDPNEVSVRFRGSRRSLRQLDTQQAFVVLDAGSAMAGEQTLRITPADVRAPGGLEIQDINPEVVRLELMESSR